MTDKEFAAEVAKTQALADKATQIKENLQTVVNPFHDTLEAIRAAANRPARPRKTKQGE